MSWKRSSRKKIAEVITIKEKKALMEAALFLSEEPLNTEEISDVLNLGSKGYVQELIDEMKENLEKEDRGIELIEEDGKFDLRVKREFLDEVAHLAPQQDIPEGTLRTLALIAYNHPVKQSKVVDMRGNRAYSQIKELKNRGLVEAEKEGRTKILKVTEEFLSYFGLETPEEFKMHFSKQKDSFEDL